MDCDHVFDILTRGPFPTGTAIDEPVETHLSCCAECRRLAEALRPAVALFQESVTPEEGYDLPGYWGEVVDEPEEHPWPRPGSRHRLATSTAVARFQKAVDVAREKWEAGGWRWVVAATAGIVLAAMLQGGRLEGEARGRSTTGEPNVTHAAATSNEFLQLFAALCKQSRVAAFPAKSGPPQPSGTRPNGTHLAIAAAIEQCCADCHTPAGSRALGIPRAVSAKVVSTCQACH